MKFKSTFTAPLLITAVLLLLAASRFLDLSMLAYHENICLAVIVLQLMILAVPSILYAKLKGESFIKRLRLRMFGLDKLLVILLASLALLVGDVLLKLILYNLGLVNGNYSVYDYYLSGEETNIIYAMLTFCLIPAICEELLFRGLLCAEYEQNGVMTAVIASSALYAMSGLSFGYFPIYFYCGLIFALVMYLTRSLFAAIICHFIYNSATIVLSDTVWNIISKPQSTVFLVFALTTLLLLALASLFGECERIYYGYSLRGIDSDYAAKCPKFKLSLFIEALLAPPFLCAALVFVVASIQFI